MWSSSEFWSVSPWKRDELHAVYLYGSHVYGTARPDSDCDAIVILKAKVESHDSLDISTVEGQTWSLKVHDKDTFQAALDRHEVYALECVSLPSAFVILQPPKPWNVKIRLDKLRETFSEKVSWDMVRAKKKFEIEHDLRRGKKSLWHALRILHFGKQIAKDGRVTNFAEANGYWEEIFTNPSVNWSDYKEVYQPIHNKLSSEFKLVAPKKQNSKR